MFSGAVDFFFSSLLLDFYSWPREQIYNDIYFFLGMFWPPSDQIDGNNDLVGSNALYEKRVYFLFYFC